MLNSFFSYFRSKKGQGMATETIIGLILLLIVLIILVLIFTNQSGTIFGTIKEFFGLVDNTPKNLTDVIQ
nr:hypothetical protein [Nanoarchaeum sp.]